MTAVDSHQNRWASYKSSTSAFLPVAFTSLSQAFDGPGLTSEGKRQAQVAGDKLRCRTNPIRHSRPFRIGSLERGINKSRWSSHSATRATRFDERQDAQEGARSTSNNPDTDEVSRDGQTSLLEVFEAELAIVLATDSKESPGIEPATSVDLIAETPSQPLLQGSHKILGFINEHLQELNAGDLTLSQDLSTIIGHGIRTAVGGFDACVRGIARGLQEVSSVSSQVAHRTRDADLQLIDDAVLGFQSLTAGFTAALGREMAANPLRTTSAFRSGPEAIETGSSFTTSGLSHDRDQDKDVVTAHTRNEPFLTAGVDPSETTYSSRSKNAPAPWYTSEIAVSPQQGTKRQLNYPPVMNKEPRFHRPGPIHLPNRSGYVDHLRRSQSTRTFDEQDEIEHTSLTPVNTHFPTLAQFEGESFGVTTKFPALPGMEPLIPQRALGQSTLNAKIGKSGPTNGNLPYANDPKGAETIPRSHSPGAGPREHYAQQNGHEAITLNPPNSAARLAGPFDPLESEPTVQPHLTEGLRRNTTIASTELRHSARRRRPYSEIFDGSGRVAWSAFLHDNGRGPRGFYSRGRPLGAHQERSKRFSRREANQRRSYDDQHDDDSTVVKIHGCIEQLRDLGFGNDDHDSAGRLLIYAQAADGELEDAIDLIDEEQQAYKERS